MRIICLLEHQGSSQVDGCIGTGVDGEFRSALLFRCARGLSEPERPRSYAPPGEIPARADGWATGPARKPTEASPPIDLSIVKNGVDSRPLRFECTFTMLLS
jgi:hypothetical protein